MKANESNSFRDLQDSADRSVVRFSSQLSPTKAISDHAEDLRKWVDVPIDELRNEMLRRNGRFQNLLGWMRHSLQANAVLDLSGRLLYANRAAEILWRVRLWEVQGKNLCQIMHFSEMETLRDSRERQLIVDEQRPHVIMEGFHLEGEHVSILYFPYPDDNGDMLMAAFILPLVEGPAKRQPGYLHHRTDE